MRPAIVLIVGVAAWVFAQAALAGQLVIVESTVAGLVSGQVLDDSTSLDIAAGSKLTVIGEDGAIRSIEGPFSGAPAAGAGAKPGGASLVKSLARLIEGKKGGSTSLGVMRSVGRAKPPDAWDIDVFRTGTYCVRGGPKDRLWRQKTTRAVTLEMKVLPYGEKVRVSWPTGVGSLEWPQGLELKDGAQYLVRKKKGMTATKLTIRVVPADLDTDVSRVAWMGEAGCVRQAKKLLAALY